MSRFKRIIEGSDEWKFVGERGDGIGHYRYYENDKGEIKRMYDKGLVIYLDSNEYYHRTDGPALNMKSGGEYYYIHGKQFTEEEFKKHFDIREASRKEVSKGKKWDSYWGFYEEFDLGSGNKKLVYDRGLIHYVDKLGKYHRVDGPSYISKNFEAWHSHGKYHRTDGPAIVDSDKSIKEYWINGKQFTEEEFYRHFGDE